MTMFTREDGLFKYRMGTHRKDSAEKLHQESEFSSLLCYYLRSVRFFLGSRRGFEDHEEHLRNLGVKR
jgi:hypothetical protein